MKLYPLLSGIVFLIVAVLHLLRALGQWNAQIGGWVIPLWLSWFFVAFAAWLAYWGLRVYKNGQG